MPRIFGHASASLTTLDRLAPLSDEATSRLARHLARTAGLELAEPAIAALAGASAGSPFYLGALVRALAAGPGTGTLDVARAAAAAACEGELARYWLELLTRAIPDRRTRATALEILTYCMREGLAGRTSGGSRHCMLKPEDDVEVALAGLARAGVVRVGCSQHRRRRGSRAPRCRSGALSPRVRSDDAGGRRGDAGGRKGARRAVASAEAAGGKPSAARCAA